MTQPGNGAAKQQPNGVGRHATTGQPAAPPQRAEAAPLEDRGPLLDTRALAIIPARGGSKGVPRKNLKLLGGKPLIAWSIEAARAAAELDRCIISTDDPEIAEVAEAYGAEVPFLRPAEYARDNTPDLPVFQHALAWLAEHEEYRPGMVVHLRPTLPFREPRQIDDVVRLLRETGADCVKSIYKEEHHPHKMWRMGPDGRLGPYEDTPLWRELGPDCPRQILQPAYWSAGLVDAIRSEVVLAGSTVGRVVVPYLVDAKPCVDLDTEHDFVIAEVVLAHLRREGALCHA
ncbi:MAG: acylneuraminate cytidylyltransferase family protein [Chloroflexi bacterium]|nr:acylneuraminate cytidylyltransferase family protein [Chloroflexota bacterium]